MGHQYAGTNSFPTDFTIPDDGDDAEVLSVDVAFEALGDRTIALKTRLDSIQNIGEGIKLIRHFANAAALRAETSYADNELAYIDKTRIFVYAATATEPDDGIHCIIPTNNTSGTGAWVPHNADRGPFSMFLLTGTGTFTMPPFALFGVVFGCGGGGGGGGGTTTSGQNNGGGGGGGARAIPQVFSRFGGPAGNGTFPYQVGAGGAGGGSNANGSPGGDTIFGNLTWRGADGGYHTTASGVIGGPGGAPVRTTTSGALVTSTILATPEGYGGVGGGTSSGPFSGAPGGFSAASASSAAGLGGANGGAGGAGGGGGGGMVQGTDQLLNVANPGNGGAGGGSGSGPGGNGTNGGTGCGGGGGGGGSLGAGAGGSGGNGGPGFIIVVTFDVGAGV